MDNSPDTRRWCKPGVVNGWRRRTCRHQFADAVKPVISIWPFLQWSETASTIRRATLLSVTISADGAGAAMDDFIQASYDAEKRSPSGTIGTMTRPVTGGRNSIVHKSRRRRQQSRIGGGGGRYEAHSASPSSTKRLTPARNDVEQGEANWRAFAK